MSVNVNIKETIFRSRAEVFDAIYDPEKLKGYFVSGSSGPLEKGRAIKWEFADYGVSLEIEVLLVEKDSLIEFEWDAGGKRAVVV